MARLLNHKTGLTKEKRLFVFKISQNHPKKSIIILEILMINIQWKEEDISKLYHNQPLTKKDIESLEKLLWEDLGSKSDYERDYEDKAIPLLIREIIGVDRDAVYQAFSDFLSNEGLNVQ